MKYITAKQLAEKLLENPNDIVCSISSNFEIGHESIPLKHLQLTRFKGEVVGKSCRDAFDGTSYSTDVVRTNNNSKKYFVKL